MEVYCMCEENTSQKERFLREVEQQLLRKALDARLLEDGLIRVKWNGQPLCSVDRDGIVRFRPADITGPESRPAASNGDTDCRACQRVYADL